MYVYKLRYLTKFFLELTDVNIVIFRNFNELLIQNTVI